jgi:hypothetical protein
MSLATYKILSMLAALPILGMLMRPWMRGVEAPPEKSGGGRKMPTKLAEGEDRSGLVVQTTPPPTALALAEAQALDEFDLALIKAFDECGLPLHKFSRDFDIAQTGKLNDVIHHAARYRGLPHPMRTVSDVRQMLKGL